MSKIEVNEVDVKCGSTLTLGSSGKTVKIATGASTCGMGRLGTVDWCTTVKTSPFSAVSGKGYMVNTCGGAITVTLPSSPTAGDIVSLKDYKDTWSTNNVTLGRGGSKVGGECMDATLETDGQVVTMVYIDGTQGWLNVQTDTSVAGKGYVAASGGNTTITCGNYKVHIFTADGCFQVTNAGTSSGSNTISYLVVAGGGGGGYYYGAGGAGGYREGKATSDTFTASPIGATSGIPVSIQTYPITVGGGGAGATASPPSSGVGTSGSNSVVSTITSAGGGGGTGYCSGANAGAGGSGGGSGYTPNVKGAGNTPPVSPPQGNPGGSANTSGGGGGGGGGALVAGTDGPGTPGQNGPGGNGANIGTDFFGPTSGSYGTPGSNPGRYFAGGGTGSWCGPAGTDPGGEGGGGVGKGALAAVGSNPGTVNTGGGGGGGGGPSGTSAGGSGFIAIRYKFQQRLNYDKYN